VLYTMIESPTEMEARGNLGKEVTKVLYIAGWGRSGSTLLEQMLAQVDGFFAAGELRYVWERNIIQGRPCSCGRAFEECDVWRKVFREAFGGFDGMDAPMVDRRIARDTSDRLMPLLMTPVGRRRTRSSAESSLETLRPLYRAVAKSTGCKVIIDSSKVPLYGYLLSTAPELDVTFVHLVRDPRGVAHSWRREKMQETGQTFRRRKLTDSAWRWVVRNEEAHILLRHRAHLTIRYEDLVRYPDKVLREILSVAGEETGSLEFIRDGSITIKRLHTTTGNPIRFNSGTISIRLDDEWEKRMTPLEKAPIKALTWPWRRKYGYE
jgi:hypothetical protein